jgi:hypothetical protein
MVETSPIFIELFISVIISVGGGTILGYLLSERSRKREEKETIEKIKELLSKDFKDINKAIYQQTEYLMKIILDLDEIVHQIVFEDGPYEQITGMYIKKYPFVFWHSIEHSGLLIKLQKEEIAEVQHAHDFMQKYNDNVEFERNEFFKRLQAYMENTDEMGPEQKITLFDMFSELFTDKLLFQYTLYEKLKVLNKIKWIKLDTFPKMDSKSVGKEEVEKRKEEEES